jgi:hypothetical protein
MAAACAGNLADQQAGRTGKIAWNGRATIALESAAACGLRAVSDKRGWTAISDALFALPQLKPPHGGSPQEGLREEIT